MTAPGETDAAALAARLDVGLSGPEPTPAEEAWHARWRPAGVLLFARNVADAAQLTALCRRLRGLLPADGEIVADHEALLRAVRGGDKAEVTALVVKHLNRYKIDEQAIREKYAAYFTPRVC